MAIYKVDIVDVELNNGNIYRSFLKHSIGSGDSAANRFGVRVFRDGEPVSLSGVTCEGFFRNGNGENIALTSYGTVSGNTAYVTLPQACYNYEGQFALAIKLIGGGVTGTMRIVDGVVDNTHTGGAVAPTSSVPTYQEILAVYDQMVESVEKVEGFEIVLMDKYEKKLKAISPNMYDKSDAGIKPGYYATPNGWASNDGDTKLGTTHPIYLFEGETYKWKSQAGIYGSNAKYAWLLQIPGDGAIVGMDNEGTLADGYYTVTIDASGWYVFNMDLRTKDTFMFCTEDDYPDTYWPYMIARMSEDGPNVYLEFENDGSPQHISVANMSPNKFNKNDEDVNTSRWASSNGWNSAGGDARLGATHPIYLENGKTYKWKGAYSIYGDNNSLTAWGVTYPGEQSVVSMDQVGEWTDSSKTYVVLECTRSGYYVVNMDMGGIDTFMLCEANKYPEYYAVFGVLYVNDNLRFESADIGVYPLKGKTLICDGDSIASATPDSPEGKGGWFGRLQMSQQIIGANYAVGGGTITYLSADRHCISRSIDDIYDDYPALDYLIVDGGTNDADLIGQFIGDTPPQGFGTWTEDDYSGVYDDTTFCGAVESMFYKAVTYWPDAHIGYIVAMEMGHNNLNSTKNRKRYFDEAVKIAKKWHIPVLNLWENSGADARLTAFYDPSKTNQQNIDAKKFYYDGQHPTSYGYNKMQPMIEEWVKGL